MEYAASGEHAWTSTCQHHRTFVVAVIASSFSLKICFTSREGATPLLHLTLPKTPHLKIHTHNLSPAILVMAKCALAKLSKPQMRQLA